MNIRIQIISMIFSFVFGIFFSMFTNVNYKYLFSKNIVFKTVFTFIYIIDCALLYFLIIKKINNGIVHLYFLLFIGGGFLVGLLKFNRFVDKLKYCLKNVKKRKK